MPEIFVDAALLPSGWAEAVRLAVDARGDIATVRTEAAPDGAERVRGLALPGMPNLHSHAFQRAMAGRGERAGPGGDSFWTWREAMYRFTRAVAPDDLEAIATQLYIEMLKAGYTAVGEFHYLHNAPDGRPYGNRAAMADAAVAAARAAGIGLTLLPVLYRAGGFGGAPAGPEQARFVLTVDAYLELLGELATAARDDPEMAVGAAPHSLRAVPPEDLAACLAGLGDISPEAPVHIHVAEQVREVEDCLAWSGMRPVEWLLASAPVDGRWCAVHATHMSAAETAALAETGATAGLCPTTEANLGDGLFPLAAYLDAGGRFGVGSDSHVSVSPVEELRWLEYGQRLIARARNIAARAPGESTGAALYRRALAGGAAALGRPLGELSPGRRADLVVLDPEHPALAGAGGDAALDAYVFAGNTSPVRDVMVGGRWVVRDGHHPAEEAAARRYRQTVARLAADG